MVKRDPIWSQLSPMELRWFQDVGLSHNVLDLDVWQFCQDNNYLLITGNRFGKDGDDALETVARKLMTPSSLPILTIGNLKRVLVDGIYCRRCAIRLAEIVGDLNARYRGSMCLYLP